jgi:hypothetical protein
MAIDQNGKEFLDHVFTGVDALLAAGAAVAPGNKSGLYITAHSVVMNSAKNGVDGMNSYQAIGKAAGDTIELIGIAKLGRIFGLGFKAQVTLEVAASGAVNEIDEFSPVGDAFSTAFDTYVRNADEFYTRLSQDEGYREDVKEALSSMFSSGYYNEVKEYYSKVSLDDFFDDVKEMFSPPPASGRGSLVYVEQNVSSKDSIIIKVPNSNENIKAAVEEVVQHNIIKSAMVNNHSFDIAISPSNLHLRNALTSIDDYQFLLSNVTINPGEKLDMGSAGIVTVGSVAASCEIPQANRLYGLDCEFGEVA